MTLMNPRRVIVRKNMPKPVEGQPGRTHYVLEPVGEATFHQFGMGYEEFESGPGNFTTAVIEWPDGRVENVPVEHVQFAPNCRFGPQGDSMSAAFDTKAIEVAKKISDMANVAYPGGDTQHLACIQGAVLEAMQWATNFQEPPIAKHGSKPDATGLDQLVHRFLTWPVPAEVYPDGTPGKPGRTGTNLLTAEQAGQMLDYVLGGGQQR